MNCSPNSSGFLNHHSFNVYTAGEVGNQKAKTTRVVHISDTRGAESCYINQIPKGDILIHSGDFSSHPGSLGAGLQGWRAEVAKLNKFFKATNHKYKIFVPGCWDFRYESRPCAAEIQKELTEAIYLENSECRIMGLSIYGVPWVASDDLRLKEDHLIDQAEEKKNFYYRKFRKKKTRNETLPGFIVPGLGGLLDKFKAIPENLDICISHSPAWRPELSDIILNEKKPKLHLSGHDFSSYGVMWRKGIIFSNAALQLSSTFPLIPHARRDNPDINPSYRAEKRLKNSSSLDPNNLVRRELKTIESNSTLVVSNSHSLNGNGTCQRKNSNTSISTKSHPVKRPPRWKRKLCTKLMNAPTILTMDSCLTDENEPNQTKTKFIPSSYIGWGTEPTMIGRILSRFCCSFLRQKDFEYSSGVNPYCDVVMPKLNEDNYSKYSTTQSSYISLEQTPTSQAAQTCAERDAVEYGFIVERFLPDSASFALTSLSLYNQNGLCNTVSSQPRGPIVIDLHHEVKSHQEKDILPNYSMAGVIKGIVEKPPGLLSPKISKYSR